MPSAANAKSEKPASSESSENTPVRQIMTVIEHKIRNLEKRKSKLTSYRDLQKAGKELNYDQKVAVAKYDEVSHTLEFTKDLSKQISLIATAAEREAKKQAKKDAWVRYAAETNKIREVLLIFDCLMQIGNTEARDDFLNGTNGAVQLTEEDLKILDNLYPEVTPKHEVNDEGQPAFYTQTTKAAEHLCAIIDGKPKEILGTTYSHIKEIVSSVHACGYFDRVAEEIPVETEEIRVPAPEEVVHEVVEEEPVEAPPVYPPAGTLPVPPAPAVVPAPVYPLRPIPPITLQEVEHAYFAQQYPQQRPITEVIGSQNFFFLQESEIDSPVSTPQPPLIPNQHSPPASIPTQTFTNQHFVQLPGGRVPEPGALPMPPQPHFPPHPEHVAFAPPPVQTPLAHVPVMAAAVPPASAPLAAAPPQHVQSDERRHSAVQAEDKQDDDWKESRSPEREEGGERRAQGDGQNRYRRFGRGTGRGMPNGHRGRGGYQSGRQNSDGYRGRHGGEYQNRASKDGYQNRQYEGYQNRHNKDSYQNRSGDDAYYGNGDASDNHQHTENGGRDRDRYNDHQSYQSGMKGRGRGGPRGGPRGATRPPRTHHYNRKPENVD